MSSVSSVPSFSRRAAASSLRAGLESPRRAWWRPAPASRRGRTGRARSMPSSAARRASSSRSSGSQPNLRDRSHTAPGLRNETRSSSSAWSRGRGELAHLVGVVGDEGAHAEVQRVGDVRGALDRVRVDAARRVDSEALHQLHLAGGGKVEVAALLDHRAHHGGVRQGLERIVQVDVRQRAAAACANCTRTRSQSRISSGEPNSRTRRRTARAGTDR